MDTLSNMRWGALSVCVALLVGCGGGANSKSAAVEKLPAHIVAASTVNPDIKGRASPVVLRIYQLRGASAFQEADFFPLYEQEQATLGADLISRDELNLRPAESRDYQLNLDGETRYLGVTAAFRDIDKSQWRALIEVGEKKGFFSMKRDRTLSISIERLTVKATFADKPAEEKKSNVLE